MSDSFREDAEKEIEMAEAKRDSERQNGDSQRLLRINIDLHG
jgi:hypothetical protein